MMEKVQIKKTDQKIIDEIINSIKQEKYGEVIVKIHHSKIVQIERIEKKRF